MLGTENTESQFCGNCDRYVVQSFYKHRIGSEKEKEEDFPQLYRNGDPEYKVVVEDTGLWSPFKGLLQISSVIAAVDGNLKNRIVNIGIVNVRHLKFSFVSKIINFEPLIATAFSDFVRKRKV
jgi:hypothetical protein